MLTMSTGNVHQFFDVDSLPFKNAYNHTVLDSLSPIASMFKVLRMQGHFELLNLSIDDYAKDGGQGEV